MENKKAFVVPPAGDTTHTEGQQPVGVEQLREELLSEVLIQNARDRRVLDWLICQVGIEAVYSACFQLAGNRKAYPSNLAKFLKLKVPEDLSLTSREEARSHLDDIKKMICKAKR
jgi:hypothetical protein